MVPVTKAVCVLYFDRDLDLENEVNSPDVIAKFRLAVFFNAESKRFVFRERLPISLKRVNNKS